MKHFFVRSRASKNILFNKNHESRKFFSNIVKIPKMEFSTLNACICICTLLLSYLFALKGKLTNYMLLETVCLIVLNSCISNRFLRVLIVLLCICNGLQFINVFFVGGYIEALTLENLDCAGDIGFYNIIKLSLIFLMYFTLLIKSKINLKHRKRYFPVLFCAILAITLSEKFPINSLFKTTKIVIENIFIPKDVGCNGDLFKKNNILKENSSWNYNGKKNIILLFTEGTSLRVISKELTPNADALRNKSIVFENYYNHTATTYRGIRGQLISGIQHHGGCFDQKCHPESLQSILKNNGYYTIFISPHASHHPINNFFKEIGGFDKVYSETLSDKKLYKKIFEEYEFASKKNKPFLIVAYVVGTHEGMDSPDIKYKNGSNPYLNKFHNNDVWFGKFFEKYIKSSQVNNTILVYTTDHCTHSSEGYNSTFNYPDLEWIDTIPLFLYNPSFDHKVYNANGLTSLTLTPTLLDMLGFHKVTNHFLGHSLFETGPHDSIEYQRFLGKHCIDTKSKKELDFKKDCYPAEEFYRYAG